MYAALQISSDVSNSVVGAELLSILLKYALHESGKSNESVGIVSTNPIYKAYARIALGLEGEQLNWEDMCADDVVTKPVATILTRALVDHEVLGLSPALTSVYQPYLESVRADRVAALLSNLTARFGGCTGSYSVAQATALLVEFSTNAPPQIHTREGEVMYISLPTVPTSVYCAVVTLIENGDMGFSAELAVCALRTGVALLTTYSYTAYVSERIDAGVLQLLGAMLPELTAGRAGRGLLEMCDWIVRNRAQLPQSSALDTVIQEYTALRQSRGQARSY